MFWKKIFASRGFNSGHKLKLTSDNKFIDESYWAGCLGGGGIQKTFGSYQTDNGKTILKPDYIELSEYPIFDRDSSVQSITYKYNPDSLRIQTEYYLVEWRRNKYLLSESEIDIPEYEHDFIRFAQYFNSESRRFKFDGFLYRDNEHTCDSLNPDFDYNQIPKKWQKYFLKHAITAKIKKMELVKVKDEYGGSLYRAELNKGAKDSIYNGLYISTKNIGLFIDSTFQNKSYTTIYLYENESPKDLIGTLVKTKWN